MWSKNTFKFAHPGDRRSIGISVRRWVRKLKKDEVASFKIIVCASCSFYESFAKLPP